MSYILNEKCPCRDCSERTVGCHATCENYKAWKEETDRVNENVREKKKNYRLADTHGDYLKKVRGWSYQNREY